MSKLFRTQNTGASQTTEATQNEKIKVYDTSADLTADLANLAENEIVAIKETDNYNEPVDVIENGNMHAVTSNAVADALTYSTTENAVGTWIDGKPIYRRVFELDNDSSDTTLISAGVVDTVVTTGGWWMQHGTSDTTRHTFPWSASSDRVELGINQNGRVFLYHTRSSIDGTIFIEYTKA